MLAIRRRLAHFVFGKPRSLVFRDDRLGELTSIVRRDKPGKWCVWEGATQVEGERKATRFALSGDSTTPNADLLAEVRRVLDGLGSIRRMAALELASRATGSIDDCYLSDVGDWEPHDGILQIELSPIDRPVLASDVTFEWRRGERNHRVVIRATDRPRIAQGQQLERGLA